MNNSYYSLPPYNTPLYSPFIRVYYIASGLFSMLGNLYLIFLFAKFPKLRAIQCNWLIIFLCASDVLIGFGTYAKGIISSYVMDKMIIGLNYFMCTILTFMISGGYKIGQTIGLLIAIDRLIAILTPVGYAKRQGNKIVFLNAMITITVLSLLLYLFIYGTDISKTMSLSSCFSPNGAHFIPVSAIYSGIVSIIFFATYLTSLLLFTRHIAQTKNQQVHAQKQLSKVQRRIFISVSIALLCYSIFYAVSTILQMLNMYFNLTGSIFSLAGYLILLGAELNGCLNVLIYLMTHMEFKECSKKTISHCIAKPTIVGSNLVFLIAPNSTTRRS